MSRFQATHWSLIQAAHYDPERARLALEELCRTYRPPVRAFIRQHGHSASDAEDLTQEFFVRFIERGWYAEADPMYGRFRSLLLTRLRYFLIDQHARNHAAKRGSGHVANAGDATDIVADTGETPEQAFTRTWLVTVVSHAMSRLQREWEQAGKGEQFEQLAPLLVEHADSGELLALATETGSRSNTIAVQVHRMRLRLRQLVRLELLQTVSDREALEEELAELRGSANNAA